MVRIRHKASSIHNINVDNNISNDKDNNHDNSNTDNNKGSLLQWNTTFDDTNRISYHQNKMKSKDTRPGKQLRLLGLQEMSGNVIHEILT